MPKDEALSIFITSAPKSANTIPQKGPGPIPENSMMVVPFSGPVIYLPYESNALKDCSKSGNNINVATNEVKIANDVKVPNKTVGEKFEKLKIRNPIEIVSAVYKIALPIVVCDLRIASLGATPFEISTLYLYK